MIKNMNFMISKIIISKSAKNIKEKLHRLLDKYNQIKQLNN